MSKRLELAGKTFGHWLVEEFFISTTHSSYWKCKCLKCGTNNHIVQSGHMRRGNSTKCKDCAIKETKKRSFKHGYSSKNLYITWTTMKQRCENKNLSAAKWYYEKGIKVCDEWQDSFTFIRWAEANGHQPGMQIHRKNSDGDYCPENCIFLTASDHRKLHAEENSLKKKAI